jgi:hypothetical protein
MNPFAPSDPWWQSYRCSEKLPLLELQAVVQTRLERDIDDVSNLCSLRKASAARSPMMINSLGKESSYRDKARHFRN